MTINKIIVRLQKIAFDPQLATDQGDDEGWVNSSTGEPVAFIGDPPASLESLERVESELGFRLPDLLRRMYLEVGDGGFGPGYGLLALERHTSGDQSYLEAAVTLKELGKAFVPVTYWGCSVFSYAKLEPPHAVYIMDWDGQDDDHPLEEYMYLQADSLEDFFVKWFDGEDLFSVGLEETSLRPTHQGP
jgi:hypothetical protein